MSETFHDHATFRERCLERAIRAALLALGDNEAAAPLARWRSAWVSEVSRRPPEALRATPKEER